MVNNPKKGSPAILVWSPASRAIAERIRDHLKGGEVFGRDETADVTLTGPWAPRVAELFLAGRPIIGLCAAGILIRILAPHLSDKAQEPPVVAVAQDGSAVVPLLGGHRGGNRLARDLATMLGIEAAITTASDLVYGVAFDDPPSSLVLANPEHYPRFATLARDRTTIRVTGEPSWLGLDVRHITADTKAPSLTITCHTQAGAPGHLVYHPKQLAIGVGSERNAPVDETVSFVRHTLNDAGYAEGAVAGVYSIDLKSDEPAIHGVANALGVPARFFDASVLEALTPQVANPSEIVFKEVGAHSVAEAAALAAAGPSARLVVEKRKDPHRARATCAIAAARAPFDGATVGAPQGRLMIVGIGPGTGHWRTPEASFLLTNADDLVGYTGYLDQIADQSTETKHHGFGLGEEEDRVRHALNLAAKGRTVALISSGDAGIYAMATLVYEMMDRNQRADWHRIEINTAPGISALQAAAARAGAPLGHDFCTVSLSDLLTPWDTIERRLHAAAEGDFVIAVYNPVSRRRRTQLPRAREILLNHRPAKTPVVLARQLGRQDEKVTFTTLEELNPDDIDMLTVVLIGSSQTRLVNIGRRRWIFTPRGYDSKADQGENP